MPTLADLPQLLADLEPQAHLHEQRALNAVGPAHGGAERGRSPEARRELGAATTQRCERRLGMPWLRREQGPK